MTFSKETGYLLRVLAYLRDRERPVSVKEVAEDLEIPRPFLAKLVQRASRRGWIQTKKGPGGGMTLGVDAHDLRVLDVVEALEGNVLDRCILGLPECGGEHPCPLHARWEPLKIAVKRLFETTTLADLSFEQLHRNGSPEGRKPE